MFPDSSQYQPSLPEQSPFLIYEQLRQVLMQLHMQGLPGADKMLKALNDVHISNIGQAGQQGQRPNVPQNPTANNAARMSIDPNATARMSIDPNAPAFQARYGTPVQQYQTGSGNFEELNRRLSGILARNQWLKQHGYGLTPQGPGNIDPGTGLGLEVGMITSMMKNRPYQSPYSGQ